MTRYGAQEGAARGPPAKRGCCQSPLDGLCGRPRMIANCWLRPGSSSANNVPAVWAKTLYRLGGQPVSLLRAASGFSESSVLDPLDQQPVHYIVALRHTPFPLQRALVETHGWWAVQEAHGKSVEGLELPRFA